MHVEVCTTASAAGGVRCHLTTILTRLGYMLWDPPSICGDSDLRCLNDCV